jgi:uncharacterized membrane protein
MKFTITLITFLAMFISLLILDYIWLGIITKKFIINQFGSLVKVESGSIKINMVAGILAWLAIAIGCYIFAVYPSNSLKSALVLGALFGFISYSIYDLTNLAFIVKYPLKFVFVDIAWGTVLCSVVSVVGYLVKSIL